MKLSVSFNFRLSRELLFIAVYLYKHINTYYSYNTVYIQFIYSLYTVYLQLKRLLRIFHSKFYESLLAVIIYFFKTVELDDRDTQHQNAVYGKSSKILLGGIIINWIAILFFALSKYQLSVRKEGFKALFWAHQDSWFKNAKHNYLGHIRCTFSQNYLTNSDVTSQLLDVI